MNKGKKAPKVEEPVITEDDKQNPDPFIRSVAKKIRNINKKIADIEALQKREDLKPEQEQKINSKAGILEEKRKFEEYVKFYKTSIVEAEKDQGANQLNPTLVKLSNGLVTSQLLRNGFSLGSIEFSQAERAVLEGLGNILPQGTIRDLTTNLTNNLNQFLQNKNLSGKIEEALTQENVLNTRINNNEKKTEEAPKPKVQKSHQKESPIKESKVPEIREPIKQITQVILQTPKVEVTAVIEAPVPAAEESWVENVQTQPTPTPPAVDQPTQQQTQEGSGDVKNNESNVAKENPEKRQQRNNRYPPKRNYDQNRTDYKPRDNNYRDGGNRNNGDRQGGYREGGYKNYRDGDRNTYKPKYQQKQVDARSDTSLEDSDNEEIKRRKFNNREINDLQNEGFVVVQKKPKAKNPHENQNYNRKQHGYKDKANYHYAN